MSVNFDMDELYEALSNLPIGTLAVIKLFDSKESAPPEPDEDDKLDDPYMGLFDDLNLDFAGGGGGGSSSGSFFQMESGSSSSSISGLPVA